MRPCGPEPLRRERSIPASPANLRASGVTEIPPESRAGPKLRSGVRTSRNGSSLIGCCGDLGGAEASSAAAAAGAFGVELLHAHFVRHVYERHSHEGYAIGVTEAGVQAFHCRGALHADLHRDIQNDRQVRFEIADGDPLHRIENRGRDLAEAALIGPGRIRKPVA